MRSRFKEYIDTKEPLQESFLGKSYALIQNKQHSSNRTKLLSVISRIQSLAKKGISENDQEKRSEILFSLFLELASALKVQAEMSRNEVNVSTAGVLDTKDLSKELQKAITGKR